MPPKKEEKRNLINNNKKAESDQIKVQNKIRKLKQHMKEIFRSAIVMKQND